MAKPFRLAFVLLVCFAALGVCAVDNPSGAVRKTGAADFFRHPQAVDKYNEMWSYVFVLNNGTKVYVNYTWMYVPTQGFKIGTDFSIWNFNGKSYSVGRQYSTEKFVEDKAASSISINNGNYLMEKLPGAGHRVVFSANKNGKKFLDITFTSAVAGQVKGDGVFNVDGEKFALFVHIPYGVISGRIGIGDDTVAVQGYGYMDHAWQTEKPTEMAARMVSFSSPSAKSLIAGRVGITKKGVPFGYALHSSENGLKLAFADSVLENKSAYNAKAFPKNLEFVWSDSAVVPTAFETNAQETFSILSNFDGFLERNVVKLALGDLLYKRGRSSTKLGKLDWIIAGF